MHGDKFREIVLTLPMQLKKLRFAFAANICSETNDSPAQESSRGKRSWTRIVEARNYKTEDEPETWSNQRQHGIVAVQKKQCSWLLSNLQEFGTETTTFFYCSEKSSGIYHVRSIDWRIRSYVYPDESACLFTA